MHRRFSWEDEGAGLFGSAETVCGQETGAGLFGRRLNCDEEEGLFEQQRDRAGKGATKTDAITTTKTRVTATGVRVRRKPVKSTWPGTPHNNGEGYTARLSIDSSMSISSDLSFRSGSSASSGRGPSMPTRPPPPVPAVLEDVSRVSLPSILPLEFHGQTTTRQPTPSLGTGFPQRTGYQRSTSSPTRTEPLYLFPGQKGPGREIRGDMPMILRPAGPQFQEQRRSSLPPIQQVINNPKHELNSPTKSHASSSTQRPITRRDSGSPTIKDKKAKSISYTAMLDFTPVLRKSATPPETQTNKRLTGANGYEIPDRLQGTKNTTVPMATTPRRKSDPTRSPKRDKKYSLSNLLLSPRQQSHSNSLASPICTPLIGVPVDPSYRGGYESSSDSETSTPKEEQGRASPSFRPPLVVPAAKRPPLPRISTDLSVEPLDLKYVPRREVQLVSAVDIQSAEITEILDLYLAEVVADATRRGVMSWELRAFLESPVRSDWEVEREEEGEEGLMEREREKVRSVSLVRRALRGSLKLNS